MIKAAVTGGESRSAGELLRLLINHPDVVITWVHSRRYSGAHVSDVHRGLLGETFLKFGDTMAWDGVDLLFMCEDEEGCMALEAVPRTVKIIDLTGKRMMAEDGHDFIYGLPELNRKALVRGARHVASPGAVATSVSLALLPLAKEGMLSKDVHAAVVAGDSVAAECAPTVCDGPAAEVRQVVTALQDNFASGIDITTLRMPCRGGLLAVVSMGMPSHMPVDDVRKLYEDYYSDHSFAFVSPGQVGVADVLNTNKAVMHVESANGQLIVTVAVDDLLKGGAGNAVHCMNLLFGLHERVGLILKSSGH